MNSGIPDYLNEPELFWGLEGEALNDRMRDLYHDNISDEEFLKTMYAAPLLLRSWLGGRRGLCGRAPRKGNWSESGRRCGPPESRGGGQESGLRRAGCLGDMGAHALVRPQGHALGGLEGIAEADAEDGEAKGA